MGGARGSRRGARLLVAGHEVRDVVVADTYLRRLRGMLLRRRLPDALLLVPGGSVHGMGMTRSLDVAVLRPSVLGGRGRPSPQEPMTVAKIGLLRPFALVGGVRGACATLEAPAGRFGSWGLQVGDEVRLVDTDDDAPPDPAQP
ncbi:hypothetical protein [Aquipuribacter sp. MA13-6]|uniref:hypothetical protein n=1 Tax=unclassified Aquipuribacter TaxID=2635084 RepID=UPI003EEF75AE